MQKGAKRCKKVQKGAKRCKKVQAEALHAAVLEFKRELPSKDKKVMKTVVAYANCRGDVYEIPMKALRELVANAILHRNYLVHAFIQVSIFDNRVEIVSPGELYDNLTVEEMLSGNTVRMMIARPSLPAKRERQPRKRRPHKRDEALLAFLKAHPGAPLREAADAFFVNVSTISRFVQDMRNEGRL